MLFRRQLQPTRAALRSTIARHCANVSAAASPLPASSSPAPSSEAPAVEAVATTSSFPAPEAVREWRDAMLAKYGPRWHLLRPVYRDLVDEMRHEIYGKPPAPIAGWVMDARPEHHRWVSFRKNVKGAEVVIGAPIRVADPDHKNQVLTVTCWYEVIALIRRNGVILEANIGVIESNMQVRNIKCYAEPRVDASETGGDEAAAAAATSAAIAEFMRFDEVGIERRKAVYDGPYIPHMEQYVTQELYDVLMDYDVDNTLVRFVAEWVFYLDHVAFVRWSLDMISHLGGLEKVDGEGDLITSEERETFQYEPEEWMPLRKM